MSAPRTFAELLSEEPDFQSAERMALELYTKLDAFLAKEEATPLAATVALLLLGDDALAQLQKQGFQRDEVRRVAIALVSSIRAARGGDA